MGNWNITIQGVGCHHNNDSKIDADIAFKEFISKLKQQGHTIEHAFFTYGGKVEDDKPNTASLEQLTIAKRMGITDEALAKIIENARHQHVARITINA